MNKEQRGQNKEDFLILTIILLILLLLYILFDTIIYSNIDCIGLILLTAILGVVLLILENKNSVNISQEMLMRFYAFFKKKAKMISKIFNMIIYIVFFFISKLKNFLLSSGLQINIITLSNLYLTTFIYSFEYNYQVNFLYNILNLIILIIHI